MRGCIRLGLILAVCGWVGGTLIPPALAQNSPLTVMVPMRDGIRLATDVRLPTGNGPWPVALVRTPYGKSTALPTGWDAQFAQYGIVAVAQDTRGRYSSEGAAIPYVPDGWGVLQDGFDTVGWIRQQPWCNGRIATHGTSLAEVGSVPGLAVDTAGDLYVADFYNDRVQLYTPSP